MEDHSIEITMEQIEDYQFKIDFGVGAELLADEPEPLGDGKGPNASRILSAAVGNCLSASLLFCLQKARVASKVIKTVVTTKIMRNENKRLRIGGTRVSINIELDQQEGNQNRINKCIELFEDFCIVTQSVRGGIDVDVEVIDQNGKKIYENEND